ncbi:MAG TPA: SigE family RNA polymerase sigma factor [Jatrophihabitantaceae bacterium]
MAGQNAEQASPDAFVREHTRTLFGTAYLLTGDAHAAEELVQDTLVACLAKWDRVGRAQSPVAYVRRSVVHRFLDGRKGPRGRVVAVEQVPDQPVDDIAEIAVTRDSVQRMLGLLPDRQRAAIVLRYLYDWPDDEVAHVLGCRQASVRSLISRALASLRAAAVAGAELEAEAQQ